MRSGLFSSGVFLGQLVVPLGLTVMTLLAADSGRLAGKVVIDGSSTVYPITEAVAEEFGHQQPRVRVTVGISGTGGGFKRFVAGETDISNASRPIKSAEAKAAAESGTQFVELPVAYDGLSIVVNKQNTWADSLTVDELKRMFLDGSDVKTWKDLRSQWPATPIRFFIPGTDSGTFDYFKEVVADKGSIRSDVSVSEDDNVLVRGIAGDKGAIGFFGCAYYFENADKIKALAIDGGNGPVAPRADTILSGAYAPFSRPLLIYVNLKSLSRPEVNSFVDFYLKQGPALVKEVGYVPLPEELYARTRRVFEQRQVGSQFLDEQGQPRRGPLSEIYQ